MKIYRDCLDDECKVFDSRKPRQQHDCDSLTRKGTFTKSLVSPMPHGILRMNALPLAPTNNKQDQQPNTTAIRTALDFYFDRRRDHFRSQ